MHEFGKGQLFDENALVFRVLEKRTRQKFECRWSDSWNAYEVALGAGALEKSRASQARCPP